MRNSQLCRHGRYDIIAREVQNLLNVKDSRVLKILREMVEARLSFP